MMRKKAPLVQNSKRRIVQVQVTVLFQDVRADGKAGPLLSANGNASEIDFERTIGDVAYSVLRGLKKVDPGASG